MGRPERPSGELLSQPPTAQLAAADARHWPEKHRLQNRQTRLIQ
jgi:hypothetical protein